MRRTARVTSSRIPKTSSESCSTRSSPITRRDDLGPKVHLLQNAPALGVPPDVAAARRWRRCGWATRVAPQRRHGRARGRPVPVVIRFKARNVECRGLHGQTCRVRTPPPALPLEKVLRTPTNPAPTGKVRGLALSSRLDPASHETPNALPRDDTLPRRFVPALHAAPVTTRVTGRQSSEIACRAEQTGVGPSEFSLGRRAPIA